jgi:hypothetical protein
MRIDLSALPFRLVQNPGLARGHRAITTVAKAVDTVVQIAKAVAKA